MTNIRNRIPMFPRGNQNSFKEQTVRSVFLLVLVFLVTVAILAQTTASPGASLSSQAPANSPAPAEPQAVLTPQPAGKLGSPATWRLTPDFLASAHKACDDAAQPPTLAECFIDQIAKAGAPPEAVAFTRELYKANGGDVGIMGEYRDFGHFAIAWIQYPLRANHNDGIEFVGSDPKFLDVDDLSKLDQGAILQNPQYQQGKKSYPNLQLFAGDRTGAERQVRYSKVYGGLNPGELRFLFSYPLLNGCQACAQDGWASFWWDFDANGKFLGTKLVSVTSAQPPARPQRQMRPGLPMPAQPKSAPPAPAPTEPNAPPPPH